MQRGFKILVDRQLEYNDTSFDTIARSKVIAIQTVENFMIL